MLKFPDNFLWGAATSAYQVEGDNTNSDWWEWEKSTGHQSSGEACRHYEFYTQDFDLAKSLHHNAHRLSLEWSRIEPEEGVFSKAELDHYRKVIAALVERGIEPVVTLHHFSNPVWLAKSGGWENPDTIKFFLRYVELVTQTLADKVKFWVTINEPMIYIYYGYVVGAWPPQKKSFSAGRRVKKNFTLAHIKAYKLIHGLYKKRGLPDPMVSIAQNMQAFVTCRPSLRNSLAVYLRNRMFNFSFINTLRRKNTLDFIGLNYYARNIAETHSWTLKHLLLDDCKDNHLPAKKNSLGWDIYPEGIYQLLIYSKRYRLPVFILENGICTEDDTLRWEYISQHLKSIHHAISEGVRVMGYLYWSLLDNYEWDKGFAPRFGIVGMDYHSFERTARDSAKKFSEVCKSGAIE